MAEDVRYSITIQDETESGNDTVATQTTIQTASQPGTPLSRKEPGTSNSKNTIVTALIAVKQIEPYVNQAINFRVSNISFMSGSAELQQRAQIYADVATSAISIGMSAVIGGIPGAVAMVGMQMLNGAISAAQNSINIQNSRNIEAETLENRRSRVGMIAGRSREA